MHTNTILIYQDDEKEIYKHNTQKRKKKHTRQVKYGLKTFRNFPQQRTSLGFYFQNLLKLLRGKPFHSRKL